MLHIQVIIWASVFLQVAAVILALRLIPLTQKTLAWILFSCAFLLMTSRRTLDLLFGENLIQDPYFHSLVTKSVALTISLLLVIGLLLIKRMFIQQQQNAEAVTKLSLAIEQSPSSTLILDTTGRIEYANEKYCQIHQTDKESLFGHKPVFLNPQQNSVTLLNKIWQTINKGEIWKGEFCNKDSLGVFHWDRAMISPMCNNKSQTTHFIVTLEDITTEKEQHQTIQHIAQHDILTNLPNLTQFNQHLDNAIIKTHYSQTKFCVYLLDIQNFKEINNALGHITGDVILREISRRLNAFINKDDGQFIARLGSDEFLLGCPDCHTEKAQQFVERLCKTIQKSYSIENRNIELNIHVGYAVYPTHGENHDEILNAAEVAMYASKAAKTTYLQYDKSLDIGKLKRLELTSNFKTAAEENQFILFYQPQINFGSKEITNVEALIRWLHPQHGLIQPNDFIELAEETGHISIITNWLIIHAFNQLNEWHKNNHKIGLSINISAQDLQNKDILDTIETELKKLKLDPAFITIEITESSIMLYSNETSIALQKINDLGIKISIDDFGTGYSSLQHLKRMPVNEMKIDRSFVSHMTSNDNDAVIVRSTIDLAHNLGLHVVAEGIEDQETADILEVLGCDYGQGYLIAKPMSSDEFSLWLNTYKRRFKHYH